MYLQTCESRHLGVYRHTYAVSENDKVIESPIFHYIMNAEEVENMIKLKDHYLLPGYKSQIQCLNSLGFFRFSPQKKMCHGFHGYIKRKSIICSYCILSQIPQT